MSTIISQAMANAVAATYAAELNGTIAHLYGDTVLTEADGDTSANTSIAEFSIAASSSGNVVTLVGAADLSDATDTATFLNVGGKIQGAVGSEVTIADPAILVNTNINIISMTVTVPLS